MKTLTTSGSEAIALGALTRIKHVGGAQLVLQYVIQLGGDGIERAGWWYVQASGNATESQLLGLANEISRQFDCVTAGTISGEAVRWAENWLEKNNYI